MKGKKIIRKIIPQKIKPYIFYPASLLYSKWKRFSLYANKDIPIAVNIETNSICTRACYYCPRSAKNDFTLSNKIFYSIVDQLKKWGFKGRFSPHSYNEPLTDKRIFDFIKYAKKQLPRSKIIVYSNGDLLSLEIFNKLVDAGISHLKVSIHEPTTDKKAEELYNLRKKYPRIITVYDFRDKSRNTILCNRGGDIEINKVKKIKGCPDIETLTIRSNGNVVLCCQDSLEKHVFGNANIEKIKDIWNKENLKKIRQNIRKGKYDLPICQKCGYEIYS